MKLQTVLTMIGAAALSMACQTQAPKPAAPAPALPVPPRVSAPPAPPPAASKSHHFDSIADYRRAVAAAVYETHRPMVGVGVMPAMLPAVVVLEVEVDAAGAVTAARLKRGGADATKNAVALEMLRRTVLPAPSSNLLNRHGTLDFYETWFFDHDGKFQLLAFEPKQARQ
jgi:periplasmic protein TonB